MTAAAWVDVPLDGVGPVEGPALFGEDLRIDDTDPLTLADDLLAQHHAREAALRRALVDALAHVEAGTAAPGVRIREWRELAGVPYRDGLTSTDRRDEGTARAGAKWTDEEQAQVDRAIRTVARKALNHAAQHPVNAAVVRPEFTADNVWRELGPEFPVTKGLTGRLIAAVGKGVIRNTGTTTIADRGGDHDHGQRLCVWAAVESGA